MVVLIWKGKGDRQDCSNYLESACLPRTYAAAHCRGEADAGLPDETLSAPSHPGEADEGLPEVALPAPRPVRSSMADWRRGILTVVGYMIYVTWVT